MGIYQGYYQMGLLLQKGRIVDQTHMGIGTKVEKITLLGVGKLVTQTLLFLQVVREMVRLTLVLIEQIQPLVLALLNIQGLTAQFQTENIRLLRMG